MICPECAREADTVKKAGAGNGDKVRRIMGQWNLEKAKYGAPLMGHAGCKGCDCQHKKIKEDPNAEAEAHPGGA